MANGALLEELRSQVLDSIKGRKLGLDANNYLVGALAFRNPILGSTGGGSTVLSSATASLVPYGVSMVGSSGTSAATSYTLQMPIPGVKKTLFVPTTGYAVVTVTTDATGAGAGAFLCSTASVTSTYQIITFTGKGNFVELIGLTTALWGVVNDGGINTVTLTSAASTSSLVTRNVTFS